MSDRALAYLGMPRRTGFKKMSSPSSTMPGMTALPPFELHRVDTVEEATGRLLELGERLLLDHLAALDVGAVSWDVGE